MLAIQHCCYYNITQAVVTPSSLGIALKSKKQNHSANLSLRSKPKHTTKPAHQIKPGDTICYGLHKRELDEKVLAVAVETTRIGLCLSYAQHKVWEYFRPSENLPVLEGVF